MINLNNLRSSQISALATEAGASGDRRMVALCNAALSGNRRARCAVVAALRSAQ